MSKAARMILSAALATGIFGQAQARDAAPDCLSIRDIDSTQTTDDNTILFRMRDKTVFRNTLPARCKGLAMDSGGFTYVASPGLDQICATETAIRLNANGIVCQLGAFTQVPRPG
jgi:hypothetical protein